MPHFHLHNSKDVVQTAEPRQQNRKLVIGSVLSTETDKITECTSVFSGIMQRYSSVLTTKWIWCGAVPLLFASIFPEALHQVWIGALQGSPSPCPLLQPPHPTLGSADEVWPEELQSLLG